jgi:hypothetical protein
MQFGNAQQNHARFEWKKMKILKETRLRIAYGINKCSGKVEKESSKKKEICGIVTAEFQALFFFLIRR